MEYTGNITTEEGRFNVLETLVDGSRIIKDSSTRRTFTVCPYASVGDCFTEPIDALDCPEKPENCLRYQERKK